MDARGDLRLPLQAGGGTTPPAPIALQRLQSTPTPQAAGRTPVQRRGSAFFAEGFLPFSPAHGAFSTPGTTTPAGETPSRRIGKLVSLDEALKLTPTIGPSSPAAGSPWHGATDSLVEGQDGKIGPCETIFTLSNTLIGCGVLGVPYVFPIAGVGLALVLTFGVTAVMLCTAVLLVRSLEEAQQRSAPGTQLDFGLLGELAFGPKGRTVINIIFAVELWLALVNFYVLIGLNATVVVPSLSADLAILIAVVLGYVLFYVPMKALAYLSLVSVFGMAGVVAALIQSGVQMPEWYSQVAGTSAPPIEYWKFGGTMQCVGTVLFCFAGHPCLPNIHSTVQRPEKFPTACVISFSIAGLYYALCGLLAYLMYGTYVAQSFTESLGADLHGHLESGAGFLVKIVAAVFVIKLASTSPLVATPVLLVFLLITGVAAYLLRNDLSVAMSVTGLLATMTTSVLFPTAVYLKLREPQGVVKASLYVLIFLSTIFAIVGTVQTIQELVQDAEHH